MDFNLDLNDAGFLADRRDTYRRLRQTAPVAETTLNGEPTIVISRFDDADVLLRDSRAVVQSSPGEIPAHLGNGPASRYYRFNIPCVDGEDHVRLRRVLGAMFTRKAVADMKEWIGRIIARQIDEVAGAGTIDVVPLAISIPIEVTTTLLDMPRADAPHLLAHIHAMTTIMSQAEMSADEQAGADHAAQIYFDYFNRHLDGANALPAESFTRLLASAESDGRFSRDDSLSALMAVFIGSIHTTMSSLSNTVRAFGTHPEQRARVLADPGIAPAAFDEVLRYDPPVHFRHRYLTEPITMHGHVLPPGVKIMISLGSANWDETIFENPDVFDVSRKASRPIAFGGGGHFCLGAQLGRMEGQVFVHRFLERFPNFRLSERPAVRMEDLTFPHFQQLFVDLGAAH